MMILLFVLPVAKGLCMPARGVPQMTSTKYERTFVRPPARRFMSARGLGGLAARGLSAATLALSVRAIVADAAKPLAAAAFRTWTEFGRVAGIWFAANAALFVLKRLRNCQIRTDRIFVGASQCTCAPRREPDLALSATHGTLPLEDLDNLCRAAMTHQTD